MKYDCGILTGAPVWDQGEALVLAYTPGIPLEWIYAGLGLGWRRRRQPRATIHAAENLEWENLGLENAQSVVPGDGWKMLAAVSPGYSGSAPMWSRLELQNDVRSNAAIAAVLGVHRETVRRWRVNTVFDPLTGRRVSLGRGGFRG